MKPTYKSVIRIISKFFCIFAAACPQLAFPAKSIPTANQSPALPPARPTVVATPLKPEIKAATSFAPMVRKVAPSVVNIYSTMITRERQSSNPFLDDPAFRQFFGERFGRQFQPQERETQGLGAGTIVTSDGYILTANHVIEGAESVKVSLASGQKEYPAKIVGGDPQTDVALIKIEATNLPAAILSDSDTLEVGDSVFAIGNPFAVGQTVTMGIVSAVGRGGFGMMGYENYIQTDAAINQGNSGGALVDAEGRLVGINTWIITGSGGNQGIGFAVPINMARYVMDHLTKEGKVTRGYLGLRLLPEMTPDVARELNLPDTAGALVTGVQDNSPAAKAGFKDEDFITEINGKKINDMRQLRLLVSETSPGTKVTAKIFRDGKEKMLTAVVSDFPERFLTTSRGRSPRHERPQPQVDALDGVEVTDLDPQLRRQLLIPASVQGALVSNIEPSSPAARKGLQLNDIILAINKKAVRSADDAVQVSEQAKGELVLLRVLRPNGDNGEILYFTIPNSKNK
jgi:serine protease Do